MGTHPHRGFSPVTFVVEGEVHHRDSRGNNQVAKKGEVQWMHAGAGIIHSERPSQELVEREGMQEIIQLWINSPAEKKMQLPKYQFIREEDFPIFHSADKSFRNKVVAGHYKDFSGAISPQSEVLAIWGTTEKKGKQIYSIPKYYNTMIYLIKGELDIAGYGRVEQKNLAVFENENTDIEISSSSKANFLLLAGVPINEKVVQQGPFVMNSETEIMEAMRDYQMGKMGILIEE
ncbi:MAG: pirin family protein [Saprospiraceae bacterium]